MRILAIFVTVLKLCIFRFQCRHKANGMRTCRKRSCCCVLWKGFRVNKSLHKFLQPKQLNMTGRMMHFGKTHLPLPREYMYLGKNPIFMIRMMFAYLVIGKFPSWLWKCVALFMHYISFSSTSTFIEIKFSSSLPLIYELRKTYIQILFPFFDSHIFQI